MPFLIGSAAVFSAAVLLFMVLLGLWTHADAKSRTDRPAAWTAIVLLVPNLMGLLIYLLVGRTKPGESTGKFKKPLLVSAVCLLLATGLMTGSIIHVAMSDGAKLPTWGSVTIGKVESYWNRRWSVSFMTSGQTFSKTVNLREEDLSALHIAGDCDEGGLYVGFTQGETTKTVDVSDAFEGLIDLSEFQPGRVRLTIANDEAKNARVVIDWRNVAD